MVPAAHLDCLGKGVENLKGHKKVTPPTPPLHKRAIFKEKEAAATEEKKNTLPKHLPVLLIINDLFNLVSVTVPLL